MGFTVVRGTFQLFYGHFGKVHTVRPAANYLSAFLKSAGCRSSKKLSTGSKLRNYLRYFFPCKLLVNLSLFPQMYFPFKVFMKQLLPKKFGVGSVFQNDYSSCLLFLLLKYE